MRTKTDKNGQNVQKQTKADKSRRKQTKADKSQNLSKFEEMENSAKIRDRIEHFGELEI